jgi:hypothetical protein
MRSLAVLTEIRVREPWHAKNSAILGAEMRVFTWDDLIWLNQAL